MGKSMTPHTHILKKMSHANRDTRNNYKTMNYSWLKMA